MSIHGQIKQLHRPFLNLDEVVFGRKKDATRCYLPTPLPNNNWSHQLSQITPSFVALSTMAAKAKARCFIFPYIQPRRLLSFFKQNPDRPSDINRTNWVLLYHTAATPGTEVVCCQIRPQRFFFAAPKLDFTGLSDGTLTSETARVVR